MLILLLLTWEKVIQIWKIKCSYILKELYGKRSVGFFKLEILHEVLHFQLDIFYRKSSKVYLIQSEKNWIICQDISDDFFW